MQLMVIISCFKSMQAIEVVKNKEYSTLNYKIILNHLSTCVKKTLLSKVWALLVCIIMSDTWLSFFGFEEDITIGNYFK